MKERWYVKDFRASTMRRLGWTGPNVDRILITSKDSAEIEASSGADCVVARIQFDNRTDELGENNMADALLIGAAPDLYESVKEMLEHQPCREDFQSSRKGDLQFKIANQVWDRARAAIAKADGETT